MSSMISLQTSSTSHHRPQSAPVGSTHAQFQEATSDEEYARQQKRDRLLCECSIGPVFHPPVDARFCFRNDLDSDHAGDDVEACHYGGIVLPTVEEQAGGHR